jgi:2-oxoglutarate ferredoxin oxidoreductase subunit gamma
MRSEIRLSGAGGQGLILAGVILAEGAILSNLEAIQSQSYGPEARGGASKAEVIISNKAINFPKVVKSDILVCLTQLSFDKYSDGIKEDSIVVLDSSIDSGSLAAKFYKLPIIESAKNVIKKPMTANIITLGILSEILEEINIDNLKYAIKMRVPKGTEELNMKAFEYGIKLVKNHK